MSPLEPNWERRRLRAPREDGEMLAVPPLADMPSAIAKNREQIATWDVQILGRPIADLRRLAREEVLAAAERFTDKLDAPASASGRSGIHSLARRVCIEQPLIVSGHQPELFHPGVWAKSFVLDRLATATGGIGLHLIVDNDAVSSTRLAVPVGSREAPRIEHIPFDADAGAVAWEEAPLRDGSLFRSFADRVSAALACWPIKPLLSDIWSAAVVQLPDVGHASSLPAPRLFDLLTLVRREAERRLGLNNIELPISQLCETEAFAWFACSLLSDPQRTHALYNEVVAEYRHVHRIRNRQHPVPDLAARDGGEWFESPFWIWRAGDSRRGRLFVRATSSELQLANGETVIGSVPCLASASTESTVAQLRALSSRGWKLRPRALTNTLFARVYLADAFLHGIGGAKYDEMTDRLIVRLYGVAPPSILTVTATHRLPLGSWPVTPSDIAALKHRLWDFDHTPERHFTVDATPSLLPPGKGGRRPDEGRVTNDDQSRNLVAVAIAEERARSASTADWLPRPSPLPRGEGTGEGSTDVAELLAEKRRLIAVQHVQDALNRSDPRRASRAENNQRRLRLSAISERLAAIVSVTRDELADQRRAAESQLAANAVLRSREFSFCLFPADALQFSGPAANQPT